MMCQKDGEHNKCLLFPMSLSLMSIPDALEDTVIVINYIAYYSPSLLWKLQWDSHRYEHIVSGSL